MKRILALLLSAVMLLTVAGCNNEDTPTDTEKENVQVIRIAKTSYHVDLDSWNQDGEYGDAIKQMFSEIEGEENIKIQIDYYSPTEFGKNAQTAITNGDTSFADIMVMPLFTFGPLYAQGLLLDTAELSGLDVKSEVWNSALVDLCTFSGKTYGIGNVGFSGTGTSAMLYNKTLADSLGLENPVSLVRNGKWTWDKLRELCMKAAKDLNNDGKFTEEDRFECTSVSYDALVPVYLTAGVPTMVKTESGRLLYNLIEKPASAVHRKFSSIFTTADGMFYGGGLDAFTQIKQFSSGKCVFLFGGLLAESDEMTDEVQILPLPKYSEDSDYVASGWHNNLIITVPKIAERKELIGRVLQMIAEKSKDFQTYSIADASLNYVDRDTYIDMYTNYIAPNFSIDPCTLMINVSEDISNGTQRAICLPIIDSARTFSGYVQELASPIQSLLDEMFNKE